MPGGAALSEFVERWRMVRDDGAKTPWIRYLRPPTERLGSAQQAVLFGHTDALEHVAVSPDRARLVSADGENGAYVRLWDLASNSELLSTNLGEGKTPKGIAFTPDGAGLVVAHWDGTASTLDADTLETTASLQITDQNLNVMAICDDGRWAVVGDWDGYLHLIDVEAWKLVRSEKVLAVGRLVFLIQVDLIGCIRNERKDGFFCSEPFEVFHDERSPILPTDQHRQSHCDWRSFV